MSRRAVKTMQAYYWKATVKSNSGGQRFREGTLFAYDSLDAVDRVYDMGKNIWSRTVLAVTIGDVQSGDIIVTSARGDSVVNPPKVVQPTAPYNPVSQHKQFFVTDIGSYMEPERFTVNSKW